VVRPRSSSIEEAGILRDAHGNELNNGDRVQLTKDLKVKGTSTTLKIGTKVKNIRISPGADHDIDCKVEGIGPMKLKSQFVKKIQAPPSPLSCSSKDCQ